MRFLLLAALPGHAHFDTEVFRQKAKRAAHYTWRDESFASASLQREMKYRVLVPHAYGESRRRYPALYLLHGCRWAGSAR